MTQHTLIAPAGWEERYERGVYKDCERFSPDQIIIPYSKQYADLTLAYRERITSFAQSHDIDTISYELDYTNDISLYKNTHTIINSHINDGDYILFNYTSTPRDLLWNILGILTQRKNVTHLSYYKPCGYGEGYVSCNAGSPRLIIKKSGISYPDKLTCVLALSGFDQERLSQLVNHFEPKKILIGRQTGEQLLNKQRNVTLSLPFVDEFEFDCYDTSNTSINLLAKKIEPLLDEYNIIATSLGPKPCAITLFNIAQKYPAIGLTYIPAADYNKDYSIGINEDFSHLTDFTSEASRPDTL